MTLTIAVPVPRDLGQGRAFSSLLTSRVYERLVTHSADGRKYAAVLSGWRTSSDGRTWQLQIRDGVRFQDGSPLTASDLRDTILSDKRDPGARAVSVCLPDVVSADAASTTELVMTLARPCSFLLDDLDLEIARTTPAGDRLGTGAYRRVSEGPQEAVFVASETYSGGRPAVDRVQVRRYDTLRAGWADMIRGRADVLESVSPEGADFLASQSDVVVRTYTAPAPFAIVLNSRRPHLRDPLVRRALSRAVDRSELVRTGLRGYGKPADNPVPPTHWALDGRTLPVPHDLAMARQALRGRRLSIECLVVEGYSVTERLAIVAQRQLRAAGVDLQLVSAPARTIFTRVATGNFDAALIDPLGGPYTVFHYRFWHSPNPDPRWNQFGYSSEPVDAALDAMKNAVTDVQFAQSLNHFVAAMRDDPPAIFLVWPDRIQAISRRFELPPDANGLNAVFSLPRWRLREMPE